MEQIGQIGAFAVYWDRWSGEVRVGLEVAGFAGTREDAMQVARNFLAAGPSNWW